ncbi:CKS-1 protein [Aphelenchoides avenae]|nr:CKS-1 protein [Aphelenchus avenae]
MTTDFYYSSKYEDDEYEYRHVHVPKALASRIPRNRLMNESEWRSLGVQQSLGWVHYAIHAPEPHILLFRRPKPKNSKETSSSRAQREVGIQG